MKSEYFPDAEFHDDPYLNHPVPLEYLSHKERYEEAIRVICLTAQKIRRLQTQGEGQIDFEWVPWKAHIAPPKLWFHLS